MHACAREQRGEGCRDLADLFVRLHDVGADLLDAALDAETRDHVLEIRHQLGCRGQLGRVGVVRVAVECGRVEVGIEVEGAAEEGVQPLAFLRSRLTGEARGGEVKVLRVLLRELVEDRRVVAGLAGLRDDAEPSH